MGLALQKHLAGVAVGDLICHLKGLPAVVAQNHVVSPVAELVQHHAGLLLHPADVIEGALFHEIVIHHSVGNLGPAVQHVPPDNARAPPFLDAGALHEELLGLRLHNLRKPGEGLQILRLPTEENLHLVGHQPVPVVSPLPVGQIVRVVGVPRAVGIRPKLVFRNEFLQRFRGRAAVIAAFADEMGVGIAIEIVLEVRPRAPVVLFGHHVPGHSRVNVGGRGQIHPVGIVFPHHPGQGFPGNGVVIVGDGGKALADVGFVHLVVPRPQKNAGMVP